MHLAAIHVHGDLGSGHVDIAIQDFTATIHYRMVAAKQDDTVLGIKLHHMVQINKLPDKAAGIFCCNRLSDGRCILIHSSDGIDSLGQITGLPQRLTMQQRRQQHNSRHQYHDDMETSCSQCLDLSKYPAKIMQIDSTASSFLIILASLGPLLRT